MPGALPEGLPAPADGALPVEQVRAAEGHQFGVYVHVPFCRVRCGYCDFNTYTALDMPGVSQGEYSGLASDEVRFAADALGSSGMTPPPVSTVFFGGGTPSLLAASQLAEILESINSSWGLASGVEVTVEANPDSVDADYLKQLYQAGVTRVSFGVQSFVPHVLATLDRTHNPDNVPSVVQAAQSVGLQVSIDVIYGTPGESVLDWHKTLEHTIALAPDHVSAYSLIVEPGTALSRRVERGELPGIDDDVHAEYYEIADRYLSDAGYSWYEVSNWSRNESLRSRHNLAYWTGENWWGIGPGAHSHVGGVRWWNVKHPKAYADRIRSGKSPAAGREILSAEQRETEDLILAIRIRQGLAVESLRPEQREVVEQAVAEGLVEAAAYAEGTVSLTVAGRLLADGLGLRLLSA